MSNEKPCKHFKLGAPTYVDSMGGSMDTGPNYLCKLKLNNPRVAAEMAVAAPQKFKGMAGDECPYAFSKEWARCPKYKP